LGEYVRGKVHTNFVENFWTFLRRGIVGTYHEVSKDYLPLYHEQVFHHRFKNRENPDVFTDMITTCGK
jgi:ISXO2 transposase-like protein